MALHFCYRIFLVILILLPIQAIACPYCFSSNGEDSIKAYIGTTLALIALLVVLFGSVAFFVYKNYKKAHSVGESKED